MKTCDKKHYIRYCPITSYEDKKRLLDEMQAEKLKKEGDDSARVSAFVATPKRSPMSVPVVKLRTVQHNLQSSDIVINYLNGKSIFLWTPNDKWEFNCVDGKVVQSAVQVHISSLLYTAAGKSRRHDFRLHIFLDEDSVACPGAEFAGEIILGNSSLFRAELNVIAFLTENLQHLSSIDYKYLNETTSDGMVGKLNSAPPNSDAEKPYATEDVSEYGEILCSILCNAVFPLKDGDHVNYKDV